MTVIERFWNWLNTSVNNALSILNTMYVNSTMKPFFDLFIVIVGVVVVIRFIIMPIIGGSIGSDHAKDSKESRSDKSNKKG